MPTTSRQRTARSVGRRVSAALMAAALAALTGGCDAFGSDGPSPATAASQAPTPTPADTPTALPSFDPSSAVGDYARGFPTALLGAPQQATVLASSALPAENGLVEVSLNLATTQPPRKIVKRYARRLDEAGFAEADEVEASGLAARSVFTRTRQGEDAVETVLIGVLDDGERRLVSLSGTVAADPEDDTAAED
ncbi:hypothetical protein [Isoptericola haloaureus]|uniref:LytR cell envelope-related transcriptional attenuator n=1 Tax=Isoptericola haloaureus TaxID=1542902 RepID=A0ABU7Z762_9MICO